MTADRSQLGGELEPSAVIFLSCVNILFSVFGAFGNILVVLTVYKNTFLQAGVNFCIVSLAVADLLVSLFTQPVYVLSLCGYSHPYFQILYYVVTSTSLYASLNSLLLMTVNRLIAIYYPLRFKSILSKRNITISIICAWILSFTEGILRTFTPFKMVTPHIRVLAVIIFVAMYSKIFMVARQHRKRVTSQARSLAFNHQLAVIQSESRTSQTAALIVGTFVVSFLPITILLMARYSNKLAVEICFTIMCCSSAVNPLVYAWRSDRFRNAVLELLACCHIFRIPSNRVAAILHESTTTTVLKQHPGNGNQINNNVDKFSYALDNEGFDQEQSVCEDNENKA